MQARVREAFGGEEGVVEFGSLFVPPAEGQEDRLALDLGRVSVFHLFEDRLVLSFVDGSDKLSVRDAVDFARLRSMLLSERNEYIVAYNFRARSRLFMRPENVKNATLNEHGLVLYMRTEDARPRLSTVTLFVPSVMQRLLIDDRETLTIFDADSIGRFRALVPEITGRMLKFSWREPTGKSFVLWREDILWTVRPYEDGVEFLMPNNAREGYVICLPIPVPSAQRQRVYAALGRILREVEDIQSTSDNHVAAA